MIVDGSYTAWVRPTRRVHFALSVGMTLTGVILIAAGAFGGRGAAPLSPPLGRTADSVVSGGRDAGNLVPPAPLLPPRRAPVAPRVTAPPSAAQPSRRPSPNRSPSTMPTPGLTSGTGPDAAPDTRLTAATPAQR